MNERNQKEELLKLLEAKETRYRYNRLAYIFPDNDILDFPFIHKGLVPARSKYPKQLDFFKASKNHPQTVLIAPNGSGKSLCGGYADAVHLTGRYPSWWEGKVFKKPIKAWICGVDTKIVRDAIQQVLLGSIADMGSGLIPKDCIYENGKFNTRVKPGTPGAIESITIKHYTNDVFDGYSECYFKSYDQEVASYSGAAIDLIHLDEEPPLLIDTECSARIFRVDGIKYITFTPDKGLSDTMLQFFPDGNVITGEVGTGKYSVNFDMDDVPHFTDTEKKAFFDSLPPFQREAKFFGRPSAGSGVVYPIYEGDIQFKLKQGFPNPEWYRAYAMDPGWAKTAVVWGAYNYESDIWYIYDCYYRGQQNAEIHASAIRTRGTWIAGIIDKAANANDGQTSQGRIVDIYAKLGLDVALSRFGKEVEAGILEVWNRLSTGRLLIASHLDPLFKELRLYRRDDKGNIVTSRGRDGTGHDLLDCVRYLCRQGFDVMRQNPLYQSNRREIEGQRNETTGY